MPITKKHKSILFSGIALMAGVTLLAGCSADPLPVSKSEQYTRDFIKTFGAFDQSHDWNHATQATVTVTTPAPTEVKIMADFEGKRYIFATYTNVEGTKTLNVDIPKGISDLIVAANGKNYNVKAGGEVDTSKAARSSRTANTDGFSSSISEEFRHIPVEVVSSYSSKLPNNGQNFDIEGVISNFSFIATDVPFTFYPVYWNTNSYHDLYVFWYDAGHYGESEFYHEAKIYTTKTGALQYYDGVWPGMVEKEEWTEKGTEDQWTDPKDVFINVSHFKQEGDNTFEDAEKHFLEWYEANIGKNIPKEFDEYGAASEEHLIHGGYSAVNKDNFPYFCGWNVKVEKLIPGIPDIIHPAGLYDGGDPEKWKNAPDYGESFGSGSNYIRTKGITINLPEGTRFGLCIDVYSNVGTDKIYHRCYSSASHNQKFASSIFNVTEEYSPKPSTDKTGWTLDKAPQNNYSTASFFTTTTQVEGEETTLTRTFFGFEDWGTGECDLNDLIFMVDEESVPDDDDIVNEDKPKPEPEEWQWIIACEDLGTNDFDFNDVVFSVSAVTTEGEGDDMKSYVKVKALAAGGTLPVYVYFEKDGVRNRIAPEGTDAEFHKWFGDHHHSKVINASSFRAEGKTARIEVPNGFTMACNEKDNMGGFSVGVVYPDKVEEIKAISPYNFEDKDAGMIGTAPQMICVPSTWYWPTENTFIVDVYENFTGWCKDPDGNKHWHENPKGSYWK